MTVVYFFTYWNWLFNVTPHIYLLFVILYYKIIFCSMSFFSIYSLSPSPLIYHYFLCFYCLFTSHQHFFLLLLIIMCVVTILLFSFRFCTYISRLNAELWISVFHGLSRPSILGTMVFFFTFRSITSCLHLLFLLLWEFFRCVTYAFVLSCLTVLAPLVCLFNDNWFCIYLNIHTWKSLFSSLSSTRTHQQQHLFTLDVIFNEQYCRRCRGIVISFGR